MSISVYFCIIFSKNLKHLPDLKDLRHELVGYKLYALLACITLHSVQNRTRKPSMIDPLSMIGFDEPTLKFYPNINLNIQIQIYVSFQYTCGILRTNKNLQSESYSLRKTSFFFCFNLSDILRLVGD